MYLPLPSADIFRTPHFDEFCESAVEYLKSVDTDEAILAIDPTKVEQAIWHPSQFLVVHATPLEAVQSGQLRFHIWPTGIDRCDADIHNHSWHLASKVAIGSYVEYQPEVTPEKREREAQLMQYASSSVPGMLHSQQRSAEHAVRVKMGDLQRYVEGTVHTLPAGVFHQTPINDEEPLVTLALMGEYQAPSRYLRPISEVVGPLEAKRPRAGLEDLRGILRIIQDRIISR